MKIGVISDTHISGKACELPENIVKAMAGCDLILHAGDLVDLCVLEALSRISKVEAVCGNMDSPKVQHNLSSKKNLDLEGKKICLMHGYGNPNGLIDILKDEFLAQKPDIIVFGHSHKPMNEYIDNILFFNPGSATDTVYAPYCSYGIIEIVKGKIDSKICKL